MSLQNKNNHSSKKFPKSPAQTTSVSGPAKLSPQQLREQDLENQISTLQLQLTQQRASIAAFRAQQTVDNSYKILYSAERQMRIYFENIVKSGELQQTKRQVKKVAAAKVGRIIPLYSGLTDSTFEPHKSSAKNEKVKTTILPDGNS
jgi:multidrug resistance efflux pump